jgi:hypothetical protein
LDEASDCAEEDPGDSDPGGVEVLVEGFADEPTDETTGGEGEGKLDHGLGGDEFAEGAFL